MGDEEKDAFWSRDARKGGQCLHLTDAIRIHQDSSIEDDNINNTSLQYRTPPAEPPNLLSKPLDAVLVTDIAFQNGEIPPILRSSQGVKIASTAHSMDWRRSRWSSSCRNDDMSLDKELADEFQADASRGSHDEPRLWHGGDHEWWVKDIARQDGD